jgi:hypothetical protein
MGARILFYKDFPEFAVHVSNATSILIHLTQKRHRCPFQANWKNNTDLCL